MDQLDRRLLLGAAGVAGIAALSRIAKAGPLNPPAGAVMPTGKTTQEIYDKISQSLPQTPVSSAYIMEPGSYHLTGDLALGNNGLACYARDVDLDLNGFTITIDPGRQGPVFNFPNCRIHNGTIKGGAEGVLAFGHSIIIERIRFEDQTDQAINTDTPAYGMTIRDCVFRLAGGRVADVTAYSTVSGCDVMRTTGAATRGFIAAPGCRFINCAFHELTGNAITTGDYCTIERCHVDGGTGPAIVTGSVCKISDCLVRGATGSGISTGFMAQIRNTQSYGNTAWGIDTGDHAFIEHCHVSNNTLGGIRVGNSSRVSHNSVDFHQAAGASGIRTAAGSSGSQILDNQITRVQLAIYLDGGSHFAARNSLAFISTDIVNGGINNNAGVVVSGPAGVAAATNPFANVRY